MFLSADTLTYLMGLGLHGDKLVELVRRLDADAQAVAPVADAAREKKRERDRERYQRRFRRQTASEFASETEAESAAKPLAESGETYAHIRGEDNLSRLEITGLVVVGGVDARKPDQQTDDWPMGNAKRHAELLVETVASPWLDPQKSGGLVLTTGRLDAWKRQGASWEHDVLPVVTSATAGRRSKINGWTYFDDAIANSIAANRKALEIPEAGRAPRGQGPPSITERIGSEIAEARRKALEQLSAKNG